MVSFFGLRFGGDRKKKADKAAAVSAPQKCETADQDAMRESTAKDGDGSTDAARPNSSRSHKVRKRRLTDLPFGFDEALSTIVLPSPHKIVDSSYPGLRSSSSNPNMGSDWKNGSPTNLVSSKPAEPITRPSTSSREKPQLDFTDVPVTREASPVSVSSPKSSIFSAPKSPLGQYELKLNLPNEGTSLFGDDPEVLKPPQPLRIVKKTSTPENLGNLPASPPPASKPPSPPQSIKTDEIDRTAVLAKITSLAEADRSSSGASSQRIISADLDNEFRELTEELNYGPQSIPSPPASVHRDDNEGIISHEAFFEELGVPVIRTVEAKRDTLTISTLRRTSMEMRVEKSAEPSSASPTTVLLPPPKSSARAARPAALNLNLRPAAADLNGPRSAPFSVNRPPWTPTLGQTPLVAATPSYNTPMAASRLTHLRLSRDSFDFDIASPLSPESPMLPLSGPLASRISSPAGPTTATRKMPVRRHTEPEEEDPDERMRNFRFPDPSASASASRAASTQFTERFPTLGDEPTPATPTSPAAEPFPAFSPLKRVATAPNRLSNWPLPSPTVPTPPPAAASAFPPPSLEPLEPPRMPAAFAESTTSRVRSFSRPWTPTNEPLKFEITSPPARARTVATSSAAAARTRTQSPLRAPPPRSPPAAAVLDRGLRNPGIVGDDFGGGFI